MTYEVYIYGTDKKYIPGIFTYFCQQYLVLYSMVPRDIYQVPGIILYLVYHSSIGYQSGRKRKGLRGIYIPGMKYQLIGLNILLHSSGYISQIAHRLYLAINTLGCI